MSSIRRFSFIAHLEVKVKKSSTCRVSSRFVGGTRSSTRSGENPRTSGGSWWSEHSQSLSETSRNSRVVENGEENEHNPLDYQTAEVLPATRPKSVDAYAVWGEPIRGVGRGLEGAAP